MSLPWDAKQQLAIAKTHAKQFIDAAARAPGKISNPPRQGRLKIAYLSRDFYDHPVAHLVHSLFDHHDREQFEIYAYSFGPDDRSIFRQRIERGCEHFIDVTKLNDSQLDARIREDGIHILVDLMGYTGMARTACIARRPVPIQVSWLGYAGTMGAEFIDYLIGDSVVTPVGHESRFVEKIVRLPDAFMAADGEQPIDADAGSRRDQGLPENAIVFCCFNSPYKIDPEIFGVWMRILSQVRGSVLWLSVKNETIRSNLRREAEARGVRGDRLIFAGRVPSKSAHLARHRHADLFLDTHYYNAHATACDALLAGLPVLTCPATTFSSRVGASLVTAAGLGELVMPTLEEYEKTAVRFAGNPDELLAMRKKLIEQRSIAGVFDMRRLCRNLESAFEKMWALHAGEQKAQSITLT